MVKNIIIFLLLFSQIAKAQKIENLTCNDLHDPLGISDTSPRLSWNLVSDTRGEKQIAYQILVSSDSKIHDEDQGDIWNSGKVVTDQSLYIPYRGISLKSGMKYYWKVRVWNKDGKVSNWSLVQFFSMGLLKPADWKSKWITASKWFTPKSFRPKGLELSNKGGWADVDLAGSFPIDTIKLYPYDVGSFPKHFIIEMSDEMFFHHPKILVDYSVKEYKLKDSTAQEFYVNHIHARFVRLRIPADTAVKSEFIVRQMQVFSGNENVALQKFAREYGTDWDYGHAPFLVDGMPSFHAKDTCPVDACSITTAPLFRKEFTVNKVVKQATLYIATLGMADVFINGKEVGNELLGPPFSDYYKRIMYVTKDITGLIKNGKNVMGAMLGNGYFNPPSMGFGKRNSGNGPPALMLQATITFTDGSQQTIQTDESWKWAKSEIVMNDVWGNYEEDRSHAKTGWDNNGYKDSSWRYAKIINPPPGKLCSSVAPAIKIIGVLKPYEVQDSIVKFKENIDGWPQIKLDGKAGQTIVVSSIDGNVKTQSLTFKLASDGPTILQPHFVIFTGTTSLEIEGLSEPLSKEDISILQVNASVEKAGSFECSDPYLNQLFKVAGQTQQNYLYDFPADPSREKQGWTQDAQNMFATAAFFSNVNRLYEKWWQDMADNQDSQGYLGSVVPMVNRQVYDWNSPWWSGALVFLPWNLYQFYGDKRILEKAFEPMKKYVDFLGKMASTGEGKNWDNYPYFEDELDTNAAKEKMLIWNGAGDWLNPYTKTQFAVSAPQTTMPAYFYYATILKKTALLLNKIQDAAKYEELANEIKTRFNKKYFHPETGWYGDSTNNQTAQVLPLAVGLVAEENKIKVYQRLLDAIHARNDHIGTGFVATPFLLEQLAKYHESKLANRIVNQKDYPSWNTLIKDGTLMETWSGEGAQMPSCGGSIGTWLFESVLGIQPLEPGFKKFIIAPQPDVSTGLISATGSYKCMYGKIVSSWKYENENFSLHVEIPVNTSAVIYLPSANMNDINESGVTLKKVMEIKILKIDRDFVVLQVESGSYNFVSQNTILK